jgi:hypothetical protein
LETPLRCGGTPGSRTSVKCRTPDRFTKGAVDDMLCKGGWVLDRHKNHKVYKREVSTPEGKIAQTCIMASTPSSRRFQKHTVAKLRRKEAEVSVILPPPSAVVAVVTEAPEPDRPGAALCAHRSSSAAPRKPQKRRRGGGDEDEGVDEGKHGSGSEGREVEVGLELELAVELRAAGVASAEGAAAGPREGRGRTTGTGGATRKRARLTGLTKPQVPVPSGHVRLGHGLGAAAGGADSKPALSWRSLESYRHVLEAELASLRGSGVQARPRRGGIRAQLYDLSAASDAGFSTALAALPDALASHCRQLIALAGGPVSASAPQQVEAKARAHRALEISQEAARAEQAQVCRRKR